MSATYPIGYFREDYQYTATSAATPDYLDDHNGRFCVTPEYPKGTYCYFATVDENLNSAFPYIVGPTFYGPIVVSKVTTISEVVTTYTPSNTGISLQDIKNINVDIFPNPASDLIAVQLGNLTKDNLQVELLDITGKSISKKTLNQGSTIVYFDTQTLYSGEYIINIYTGTETISKKVVVQK